MKEIIMPIVEEIEKMFDITYSTSKNKLGFVIRIADARDNTVSIWCSHNDSNIHVIDKTSGNNEIDLKNPNSVKIIYAICESQFGSRKLITEQS